MTKLSIIIPCFNEERTIEEIVSRVERAPLPSGWEKEIVLVDDFSTDGTRGKIEKYFPKHIIILRRENGGKGAAVKNGLERATGDFIIIQDADLEYEPNDYQSIISSLDAKHPIVFGSRLRQKNKIFSLIYFYGSKTLTKIFNILFGSKFTDITSCYKLFPREVIPALLSWPENGFVFDAVYLTYELNKFSKDIIEVPINYLPRSRVEGKKVNWRHGVKALVAMVEIRTGKYWQFFKFLVTGCTALVVNLSFLYLFTEILKIHYLISSVFSFFLAVTVSFTLQKFWTFKSAKKNIYFEASSFLVMQIVVNLFLNTALLYIFVDYLHLWYILSQVLISLGLAVITFFTSKKYIF